MWFKISDCYFTRYCWANQDSEYKSKSQLSHVLDCCVSTLISLKGSVVHEKHTVQQRLGSVLAGVVKI